ncbi:MAG: efflux RND transporter periplasmic adaptor subunit [Bdellovibrionales bacterium]|nr:efflux RND transporter periplasmic adaptor subunit [Bdellovibrionales bacterium]
MKLLREGGFMKNRQALLSLGILGGGLFIAWVLMAFRTSPPKAEAKRAAALVSIEEVSPIDVTRTISGFGTVEAVRDVEFRPLVSGEVVSVHPQLQVGGRIAEGEELVKVDPRDYEIAVESAKAALEQALFELKLEEGNQVVAKHEWGLLEGEVERSKLGEELALRKPHLRAKRATVNAAKSALRKAELDLERTVITSPFNAVVLEESVEAGKFLSTQNAFARLASTEAFYVRVRVPRSDLEWLDFDANSSGALQVKVFQDMGSGHELEWNARFVRVLGDVDLVGRMAQLLVAVDRPLDSKEDPLLLGSYVRVEIPGKRVHGVYRIPRRALREGSVVWIVGKDNMLEVVKAEPAFSQKDWTFIKAELPQTARIVTSSIEGAMRGMIVEVALPSKLTEPT